MATIVADSDAAIANVTNASWLFDYFDRRQRRYRGKVTTPRRRCCEQPLVGRAGPPPGNQAGNVRVGA